METFLWHQPISPTVLSIKPKVNLPDGEPLRWAKRRLKATCSKFASALATWRRVASSGPVSSCLQSRFHPAVASANWSMLEKVCWTTRIGVSVWCVAELRKTSVRILDVENSDHRRLFRQCKSGFQGLEVRNGGWRI